MKPSYLIQCCDAEEGRLGVRAGALNIGMQDTAYRHGVIRKRAEADVADPRPVNNSPMVN